MLESLSLFINRGAGGEGIILFTNSRLRNKGRMFVFLPPTRWVDLLHSTEIEKPQLEVQPLEAGIYCKNRQHMYQEVFMQENDIMDTWFMKSSNVDRDIATP